MRITHLINNQEEIDILRWFNRKKPKKSKELLLPILLLSILVSNPYYHVLADQTQEKRINPEHFTIAVQVGDWREYNVSKYYNPTGMGRLYTEEGQRLLVTIINITHNFIEYRVEIILVSGEVKNQSSQPKINRAFYPWVGHHVTTTNRTLLEQALKRDEILIYEFKEHELNVQWIRNSTFYPGIFEENHTFIEEWNVDLKTGWLNHYKYKVTINGTITREIFIETIRSVEPVNTTTGDSFALIVIPIITIYIRRRVKRKKKDSSEFT
ncbi:MAG: hypothetical protein ACFFB5_20735 [Promethearchaeota archaeon]